jgi:NAD(P)-dependent dehydrogenase (short-subunit alcohol dehydrogenase family)
MRQLEGKGIVITGGSQGLGKAIARACITEGADVLICARNEQLLDMAAAELASAASSGQHVLAHALDVSQPDAVREAVARAERELRGFCGLVNNAAIQGPIGLVEDNDWQAWQQTIQINLFGPVLLSRAVLPVFRRQGRGKIVNLSGGGATAPRPHLSAYAAAKAAIVRLTETFAAETKDCGIDINAIAPGSMNTRMLEEMLAAGPEKVGEEYRKAVAQSETGGESPERAAALCVFLLSDASNGISGKLLSAVWDPWPNLSQHQQELQQSDVYTLRRIVPKDRGLDWE